MNFKFLEGELREADFGDYDNSYTPKKEEPNYWSYQHYLELKKIYG